MIPGVLPHTIGPAGEIGICISGLTQHDFYTFAAMQALGPLIAKEGPGFNDSFARLCFSLADAMLEVKASREERAAEEYRRRNLC